jgi:RimJ/RimL family protein N-acetyltransferase
MQTLLSERLRLRPLVPADAAFILALLNDPAWLQFIGDRSVHNLEDARYFISSGPQLMYTEQGHGMLLVETLEQGSALGLCGLLKREYLDCPDLGFAFMPEYRGKGYAAEASIAVLKNAQSDYSQIAGMTALGNQASITLLEKLGFEFRDIIKMDRDDPGTRLYIRSTTGQAVSGPYAI